MLGLVEISQPSTLACPCLSTERKAQVLQGYGQAHALLGVHGDDPGEAFAKDYSRTGRITAAEAAYLQNQTHLLATDRQVSG